VEEDFLYLERVLTRRCEKSNFLTFSDNNSRKILAYILKSKDVILSIQLVRLDEGLGVAIDAGALDFQLLEKINCEFGITVDMSESQ
jgi:hypothetical protein